MANREQRRHVRPLSDHAVVTASQLGEFTEAVEAGFSGVAADFQRIDARLRIIEFALSGIMRDIYPEPDEPDESEEEFVTGAMPAADDPDPEPEPDAGWPPQDS